MSPKQQRGAATAAQVLDSALELYASRGEAGLTLAAITSASGVSTGSVYHHFGSLHGVVLALAQSWLGRLLEELAGELGRVTGARAGVHAVTEAYLRFVQEHPDASRLMHSVTADRELVTDARQIRGAQEARIAPLAAWLHAHRESGELVALPLPVLESLILGPVTGIARRWLALGDIDIEEAARTVPEHIWRSVSP
ncbi:MULTISPECIES: TetR/AcrR family transcriptional regulator [unclassified Streptomyces]|uniref:TetR/AcrR family transcriptional regulator n=1 Tax=unclassified Streptomyces TaxID=2593676 RepID=UPI000DAB94B7|nr:MULTISPECIES: TetR/AcrR family transcriptional regulator [unclassified Streptomyces]PZT77438.1 TetR/AcrR family transcriptional regulator [Streptomyces sp. AC1-42W]PZT78607.1 TetR/AcrR family transcriptional regulator [Streptomyces sp. AC1-42T]